LRRGVSHIKQTFEEAPVRDAKTTATLPYYV